MSSPEYRERAPDIDRLVRSMLLLHGAHDDDPSLRHARNGTSASGQPPDAAKAADPDKATSKRPAQLVADPRQAAALHDATQRDRERYLTSGLQPVDCRFCHVSVLVKKLGPEHTSVQWNSDATRRCAYFTEVRESGGDTARSRACPRLADSIRHAIAEGVLEPVSSGPSPGDG
jgi:hypothetical protein